jgi:hypothetical protein
MPELDHKKSHPNDYEPNPMGLLNTTDSTPSSTVETGEEMRG